MNRLWYSSPTSSYHRTFHAHAHNVLVPMDILVDEAGTHYYYFVLAFTPPL